jgi:hypothetical protein
LRVLSLPLLPQHTATPLPFSFDALSAPLRLHCCLPRHTPPPLPPATPRRHYAPPPMPLCRLPPLTLAAVSPYCHYADAAPFFDAAYGAMPLLPAILRAIIFRFAFVDFRYADFSHFPSAALIVLFFSSFLLMISLPDAFLFIFFFHFLLIFAARFAVSLQRQKHSKP